MSVSQVKLEQSRNRIRTYQAMLEEAIAEHDKMIDNVLAQAKADAMAVRLKKVDIARLLGVARKTIYNRGCSHCKTYGDLRRWVVTNGSQQQLKTLEENFEHFRASQKNRL